MRLIPGRYTPWDVKKTFEGVAVPPGVFEAIHAAGVRITGRYSRVDQRCIKNPR